MGLFRTQAYLGIGDPAAPNQVLVPIVADAANLNYPTKHRFSGGSICYADGV